MEIAPDSRRRGPLLGIAALVSSVGLLMIGCALLLQAVTSAGLVERARAADAIPYSAASDQIRSNYQLVQLGEFRRDQFLVDQATGRVWRRVCTGGVSGVECDGMLVWDEMYVGGVTPSSSDAAADYRILLAKEFAKIAGEAE